MTRAERWALWSTSVATTATGVAYFWAKYLVRPVDPWAVVNHPLQPVFLKAHLLVAPLLVFSLGAIFGGHIWRHWRADTRFARRSGLMGSLFFGPMILSGYLIQAVTHVGWLRAIAWAHIATGMLYALGLALHQWVVQRAARRRARMQLSPATPAALHPPQHRRSPLRRSAGG